MIFALQYLWETHPYFVVCNPFWNGYGNHCATVLLGNSPLLLLFLLAVVAMRMALR